MNELPSLSRTAVFYTGVVIIVCVSRCMHHLSIFAMPDQGSYWAFIWCHMQLHRRAYITMTGTATLCIPCHAMVPDRTTAIDILQFLVFQLAFKFLGFSHLSDCLVEVVLVDCVSVVFNSK